MTDKYIFKAPWRDHVIVYELDFSGMDRVWGDRVWIASDHKYLFCGSLEDSGGTDDLILNNWCFI